MKRRILALAAILFLLSVCLFLAACGCSLRKATATTASSGQDGSEPAASTENTDPEPAASTDNGASGSETAAATESETFYSVSFDTDGGSEVAPQQVKRGGYAQAPENPVKIGYIFDGWTTENGSDWKFNKKTINENVTLVAKWRESACTISISGVADPYEDVFLPFEECILSFMNYDHITTAFDSFIDASDPEANEVYHRLDGLQITGEQEFNEALQNILGAPTTVSSSAAEQGKQNLNVATRFRWDYQQAHEKIVADLQSDDPAAVAAATAWKERILNQLQEAFQLSSGTDLLSPSIVGVAFNNVYKDFGNYLFNFRDEYAVNLLGETNGGSSVAPSSAGPTGVVFEYGDGLTACKPKDETEIGEGAYFPDGTAVTDYGSASDPQNWYTVNGMHVDVTGQVTDLQGIVSLSDFSGYVIKKSVDFTLPDDVGDVTVALLVFPKISITGKNGKAVDPVRVMITYAYPGENGGGTCEIRSGRSSNPFQQYRLIRFTADRRTVTVDFYVYIDGTDPACTNSFYDPLDSFRIDVLYYCSYKPISSLDIERRMQP